MTDEGLVTNEARYPCPVGTKYKVKSVPFVVMKWPHKYNNGDKTQYCSINYRLPVDEDSANYLSKKCECKYYSKVKFLVCPEENDLCVHNYYNFHFKGDERKSFETLSISFEEDLDHSSEK